MESLPTQDFPFFVDTPAHLLQLGQILGVNLQQDSFLVHLVRKALRSFWQEGEAKLQDTLRLEQEMRTTKNQVQAILAHEKIHLRVTPCCEGCGHEDSGLYYDWLPLLGDSAQFQLRCLPCFQGLKPPMPTLSNSRLCLECLDHPIKLHCPACQQSFCWECYHKRHIRGGRRHHRPLILGGTLGGAPKTQALTSLWVSFEDDLGPYYAHLVTQEIRRDTPLAGCNQCPSTFF